MARAELEVVTCTGGYEVEPVDEQALRDAANEIGTDAAGRAQAAHQG